MKNQHFILFVLIIIFQNQTLLSQVTIGSGILPNPNALLDLAQYADGTSSKGLLLPRVHLTSLNNSVPLSEHVQGMLLSSDLTNNDPSPYINDGTKWKNTILPQGGKTGQVLQIDSVTLVPSWQTIKVPKLEKEKFYMINTTSYISGSSLVFESGDKDWKQLGSTVKITPGYAKNRLMLTVQTLVSVTHTSTASAGWVSLSCGIKVGNEVKVIRGDRLTKNTFNGTGAFKLMTFYFVLENMSIAKESEISIVFKRNSSNEANNNKVKLYVGDAKYGVASVNSQCTESVISVEYYEDRYTVL